MRAQILIDRLEGVRERGPGHWMCRCPAHEDRTASLSVTEAGDTVLIKCFAACDTETILSLVGLTFSDIYPDRTPDRAPKRVRHWSAADLLHIVQTEMTVASIIASDLQRGQPLSETDQRRLDICAARLNHAVMQLRG